MSMQVTAHEGIASTGTLREGGKLVEHFCIDITLFTVLELKLSVI
jgi:hypothetical protein